MLVAAIFSKAFFPMIVKIQDCVGKAKHQRKVRQIATKGWPHRSAFETE